MANNETNKDLIGEAIQEKRHELFPDLNQAEFGDEIGLTQKSISNIECGIGYSSKSIKKVFEKLQITGVVLKSKLD